MKMPLIMHKHVAPKYSMGVTALTHNWSCLLILTLHLGMYCTPGTLVTVAGIFHGIVTSQGWWDLIERTKVPTWTIQRSLFVAGRGV